MRLLLLELETGIRCAARVSNLECSVTHFQSNGHKASVGDLISFAERDKSLPYLVDQGEIPERIQSQKKKRREDIVS